MTSFFEWLLNWLKEFKPVVVVMPWDRGVRVRAGKHTKILEPGWHLRIPILDVIIPVNTKLQWSSFPSQSLTTSDGKTITIAGNIGFRITDPLEVMMNLQQPSYSLAAFVQSIISSYIPVRSAEEIDKEEAEETATRELKEFAKGIEIEVVTIADWMYARPIRLIQESWRPETKPAYQD